MILTMFQKWSGATCRLERPGQLGIILLLLSIPGILAASNWQWMRDTAVRSFDEQDWALLENTVQQMLDQGADGDSQEWQNPETGNAGSVQVLDTRDTDEGICRNVLITNTAKQKAGATRLIYCRQADSSWKIDTRPQQPRQE